MLYHGSAYPMKQAICSPRTGKYNPLTTVYNDTTLRVLPLEFRLPMGAPSPAGDTLAFESENVNDWSTKDGHISRLVRTITKGYLPTLVPRLHSVRPRFVNQQFSVGKA